MIPVLGVPTLVRYGLLARMLASIDEPVGRIIVVDNGGLCPDLPNAHLIRLPHNLGVAAAWNLVLKATPGAPWWVLVNDDLEFGEGDLRRLTSAMQEPGPRVATLDGFAAFGINHEAIERVGFFDENFHPAYVEDCDYEYRCRLAGVPIVAVGSHVVHARSSTIGEPPFGERNNRTYPENVAYFRAKWGGSVRGGEQFTTPFDAGGSIRDWTPDLGRLRGQAWT